MTGPVAWAMTLRIGPGVFIMSWKMLGTVKRLAERDAGNEPAGSVA